MTDEQRHHVAGAFDIRNVIGALLGIYGVIMVVTGLVSNEAPAKTGQLHADLWAGIVLLVVAVVFVVWARVRPVAVPKGAAEHGGEEDQV